MSFIDLGLSSGICRNLAALGYTEPTDVQAASIPKALAGTDLLVGAQTGTGKTAAFALPIIERLLRGGRPQVAQPKKPLALVLTPTRELACQVHDAFRGYGVGTGLSGTAVFGGSDMGRQILALRRGPHVLVATPGRLIDHLEQKKVQLSSVEYLVLDEADRMLDMGFLPALEKILGTLPKKRQTWLFSATLEPEIVGIAARFMNSPERIQIASANSIAATIRHRFHPVEHTRKRAMLVHLLAEDVSRQTLVFCRTKMGCERLSEYLAEGGFRAESIHGDKSQAARLAALRKFKDGKADVLVATDVAARGLDIPALPVVVNFDLPIVPNDYIHRIGRTGRARTEGQAVSFVSRDQMNLFRSIERMIDQPLETGPLHGFDGGTTLDLAPVARRGHGTKGRSSQPGRYDNTPREPRPKRYGDAPHGPRTERSNASRGPAAAHSRGFAPRGGRPVGDRSRPPSSDRFHRHAPGEHGNSPFVGGPRSGSPYGTRPGTRAEGGRDDRGERRSPSRFDERPPRPRAQRPEHRGDGPRGPRPERRSDGPHRSRPDGRGGRLRGPRPEGRSEARPGGLRSERFMEHTRPRSPRPDPNGSHRGTLRRDAPRSVSGEGGSGAPRRTARTSPGTLRALPTQD